jgi:hypothetical protein
VLRIAVGERLAVRLIGAAGERRLVLAFDVDERSDATDGSPSPDGGPISPQLLISANAKDDSIGPQLEVSANPNGMNGKSLLLSSNDDERRDDDDDEEDDAGARREAVVMDDSETSPHL